MGMWVLHEHASFYKEDGRLFNGPDRRVEYDLRTKEVIAERKPVKAGEPELESPPTVLGVTREYLEKKSYPEILKEFKIRPQKGMNKTVLINEILGAVE